MYLKTLSFSLAISSLLIGCGEPESRRGHSKTPGDPAPAEGAPAPDANPKDPVVENKEGEQPKPQTSAPVSQASTLKDIDQAALQVCSNKAGSEKRKEALKFFANYKPGSRSFSTSKMTSSQEACVLAVLPSAIYTNLRSGVPVGTLVGQAIQETGWCKSSLAIQALNFHGQKAKFAASNFTYWDGAYMSKSSSESPTASGNNVVSKFMKFKHVDHGFYAVAERFNLNGLPYKACLSSRENPEKFMACVGKSWAVHATYTQHVLGHRKNVRFGAQKLSLPSCELSKSEWQLDKKFPQ